MSNYINIAGLILNAFGAVLLILFSNSGFPIAKTGEILVGFFTNPTPEQRSANIQKYRKHKWGFKGGIALLLVGYVLQLIAAWINL